jgi:hypothetical protein
MTIEVMFPKTTEALGRNGMMKATGLSIFVNKDDNTALVGPITSKGLVGRCWIEIPVESFLEAAKLIKKRNPEVITWTSS